MTDRFSYLSSLILFIAGGWLMYQGVNSPKLIVDEPSISTKRGATSRGSDSGGISLDTMKKASNSRLEELLIDNSELVDLEEFERRLRLDDTFDKTHESYQMRLIRAYLMSIVKLMPEKAIEVLKEKQDQLFHSDLVMVSVMKVLAEQLSLQAVSEVLKWEGVEPFKKVVVYKLAYSFAKSHPVHVLEFVKAENSELLNDEDLAALIFQTPSDILQLEQKIALLDYYSKGLARSQALLALSESISDIEEKDLSNTIELLTQDLDPEEKKEFLNGVFISLTKERPKVAFNLASSLNDQESIYNSAIWTEAGRAMGFEDTRDALQFLEQIEEGAHREAAFRGVIESWAAFDPRSASNYALSHDQNSDLEESDLLGTSLRTWIARDTRSAYGYLKNLALSEEKALAYNYELFPEIARQDPNLAKKIIDGVETQSERDSLVENFISDNLGVEQPDVAERYIDSMKDPKSRFQAYVELGQQLGTSSLLKEGVRMAAKTKDPDKRDALIVGLIPGASEQDLSYSLGLIAQVSDQAVANRLYFDWYRTASTEEPTLASQFLEVYQSEAATFNEFNPNRK